MEAPHPSFQSLVRSHSSSSPVDHDKKYSILNTAKRQTVHTPIHRHKTQSREEAERNREPYHLRSYWIYSFINHSASQINFKRGKINHSFTSSCIFFSFSFFSELETGFDLPSPKLMYKPPSSFTLMPGSMRLDKSFLKQSGAEPLFTPDIDIHLREI